MRKSIWLLFTVLSACSGDKAPDGESAPRDRERVAVDASVERASRPADAAIAREGSSSSSGSTSAGKLADDSDERTDTSRTREEEDEESCGGETHVAKGKELEILVLFDNSTSMILPALSLECLTTGSGCPQSTTGLPPSLWDVAVAEMKTFVKDARSAGITLALKYFGTECSADAYTKPDVPLGQLPQHASAIEQSLSNTLPFSETATLPALQGALTFLRQRAALPDYNARSVILLFTDGYPDPIDCEGNTTEAVARVAAEGFSGDVVIPTYVFVTSPDLALDEIARAGGTTKTIFADLARPGMLSDALNVVRSQEVAALPCEYALPPAYFTEVEDPSLVNLTHNKEPIGRVESEAACGEGGAGWYYDDPLTPTRILTCPATCSGLKRGGSVDIQLKCPSILVI